MISRLAGNGLTATLNGEALIGGSYKFMSRKVRIPADILRNPMICPLLAVDTPLFFAKGKTLLGVIAVADVIKETAIRLSKNYRTWESVLSC